MRESEMMSETHRDEVRTIREIIERQIPAWDLAHAERAVLDGLAAESAGALGAAHAGLALAAAGTRPTDCDGRCIMPTAPQDADWAALCELADCDAGELSAPVAAAYAAGYTEHMQQHIVRCIDGTLHIRPHVCR